MALSTAIRVALTSILTGTSSGSSASGTSSVARKYEKKFVDGTGSGLKADQIISLSGSLAASGTTNVDVAGAVTNPLNTTVTLARVKAILVEAADTNVNDLQVSRPASNGLPWISAASAAINLQPGGALLVTAPVGGFTATAGTGDLITLTNGGAGTSVGYKITIVGATA